VGEGAILSGVEQADEVLVPEKVVLHQVPLASGPAQAQPWVVQLYGVADNPKAQLGSKQATFCGHSLDKWLAWRGLPPEAVWPHVGPKNRCLWTARLFVAGDKHTSLRWALWLAKPSPEEKAMQQWREQERISLEESLEQADQEAIHRHRTRLRGQHLGGEIAQRIPSDDYLLPLF
jgi:hypothetical protein